MSFFQKVETVLKPNIIYQFARDGILSEDKTHIYNKFKTNFYDVYISTGLVARVLLTENLPFKDRLIRFLPKDIQKALYGFASRRLLSVNELLLAAFL